MINMDIKKLNCIKCGTVMKVQQLRCVEVNREKKHINYEVTYSCPLCKEKLTTNVTAHN